MDPLSIRLTVVQRKLIAKALPKLKVDWFPGSKGTRTVFVDPKDAETMEEVAWQQRSEANGATGNSWWHIADSCKKALAKRGEKELDAATVSQFKITLLDSKPKIWRRIHVRNCSLDELHEHIQAAMGWTNSHLYQFEIGDERYGNPRLLDSSFEEFEGINSLITKLRDVVPKSGQQMNFLYEYDFGDGWTHEIRFEGFVEADSEARYPLCLEGKRACPPEDVGGVWGYEEFLRALKDPSHEEHQHYREWGANFDPLTFSVEEASVTMQQGLPSLY